MASWPIDRRAIDPQPTPSAPPVSSAPTSPHPSDDATIPRRAPASSTDDATDAAWTLAEEVARKLEGSSGPLPAKLERLIAARREVDARETALVDAHLALLAERNLYMRRLVEVEQFMHTQPAAANVADTQLLQLISAVLYGGATADDVPPRY